MKYLAAIFATGAFSLTARSHYTPISITAVSVSDLIMHPDQFRGKHVRVSGYLMAEDGQLALLNPVAVICRSFSPDRIYITTDLSLTSYMATVEDSNNLEGRLVDVTGIFTHADDPWTHTNTIVEPPPWPAAGPLRRTRLEAVGEQRCRRS